VIKVGSLEAAAHIMEVALIALLVELITAVGVVVAEEVVLLIFVD
jgi:hypothetical protein